MFREARLEAVKEIGCEREVGVSGAARSYPRGLRQRPARESATEQRPVLQLGRSLPERVGSGRDQGAASCERDSGGWPQEAPYANAAPNIFHEERKTRTALPFSFHKALFVPQDAQVKWLQARSGSCRKMVPELTTLDDLAAQVRSCRHCAGVLPMGSRPVFQVAPTARLLVASQAPGTRVHASGTPFSDSSGQRLRQWMGIDDAVFYDARRVAILPMGFCYPGKRGGGDAPPRKECAELWRGQLVERMQEIRLTLLVGTYAQFDALGPGTMVERVRNFRTFLPRFFPLPHPSWRSHGWAQKNPWFEAEVLPALKAEVRRALSKNGEMNGEGVMSSD